MSDDAGRGFDIDVSLQAMLGYLNFSEGKPDVRFQKQLNDAFDHFASESPWLSLDVALKDRLSLLSKGDAAAFRDIDQAAGVLTLAFEHVLTAYRAHHADLLGYRSDADLWQPFFLVRVFEAILSQRGPWHETERIVRGTLRQLNDFVGHRPVAVLENRERGEVYEHERIRPIPIYLRGVGAASGVYQALTSKALEILRETDPQILLEACFDPALLDELAIDPRGYDFGHPVDKRPNYAFGEWDPHLIDNQGRYRRFVVRQHLLESLWNRVQTQVAFDQGELLFEAAAVLAGTILMAAGVSGAGPQSYDSTVNLSNLVPRIARFREAFYAGLLDKTTGSHGDRLKQEAQTSRQAFAGARQHLNQVLGKQRAWQVQQRHLALLLAEIGYPASSRRQVTRQAPASLRIVSEMHILLTTGHLRIDRGELAQAAALLPQIENLLRSGISCGAVADPWNILGFQGQFPRFLSLEDGVRDNRVEELLGVVERLFHFYARVLSEGAATGAFPPENSLASEMRRLAEWWDRFATTSVSDVTQIQGEEAAASAEHVAQALTHWRERGAAAADLAFWREHLASFHSPKSFALVVDALLRKQDFRAAMALLMTWLSQAEQVPLEDGVHSFHQLALRWMLGVCSINFPAGQGERSVDAGKPIALVLRFFDTLEANAEEYWQVPRLDLLGTGEEPELAEEADEDEEGSRYGAAYEEMTYEDTTDDDVEAEVLDVMPQKDFDLTEEAERLEKRLKFLATMARLWNIATRALRDVAVTDRQTTLEAARGWLQRARANYKGLLSLLDGLHEHEIPKPSAEYDNVVEYDRRLTTKERLLSLAVATCLDQALAVGALRGVITADVSEADSESAEPEARGPAWEPLVLRMERALLRKDPALARSWLAEFVRLFRTEPLLYTPLSQGGHPRAILRAGLAQTILRGLCANLPKQGLIRETYDLIRLAHVIEREQTLTGPRVTEFDRLFQLGVQAVTEAVIESAQREAVRPQRIVETLEGIVEPFLAAWMSHAKTLRVSRLENITSDREWKHLIDFIRRYGRDLFTPQFLAVPNMRGLLHRGIGAYIDHLVENPDPLRPVLLVDELDTRIERKDAERCLEVILQTLLENHDNLYDFNQTAAQANYGENLHQLFDFLRLKASYERNAWQLRPLNLVHEVLARKQPNAGWLWREQVEILSRQNADDHLRELNRLENAHGIRLTTIRDRVEERFVKPLAIDNVCAMIEPALEAAPKLLDEDAFPKLEEVLSAFAQNPAGVGQEVPHWLQRLEGELYRVKSAKSALVTLAETLFQVPRTTVPFDELAGQLGEWKKDI